MRSQFFCGKYFDSNENFLIKVKLFVSFLTLYIAISIINFFLQIVIKLPKILHKKTLSIIFLQCYTNKKIQNICKG